MISSRERVLRALYHEEPDRVPLDAWFSYPFYVRLRKYLGEKDGEKILKFLGVDVRYTGVAPPSSFLRDAKVDPRIHYGVGIPVGEDALKDEWGIIRKLNVTKIRSRVVYYPLQHLSLDDYEVPDPHADGRYDGVELAVRRYGDEYFILAGLGCDFLFSQGWYLRGFRELLTDMYRRPWYVDKLFDEMMKYYIGAAEELLDRGVDCILIADDLAGQRDLVISPRLLDRYYWPRFRIIAHLVKRKGAFLAFHSDGNIFRILPKLIELGVDIVNPIQPECMDPVEVKEMYGDRITLHGTLSIQRTLPYGRPNDVRREVIERIRTCGHNGGLILGPSNQVLEDTPIENFLTIYETVKKFGYL
ncbi:MAG: hypothetical protein J7L11_03215 [Thermoprotei archaeon]|nr:hypothetical protein [Thermoprotei archaeon]